MHFRVVANNIAEGEHGMKAIGYAESLNTVSQLSVTRTVAKEIIFDEIIFLSVTKAYLEKEFRVLWLGVEPQTFWLPINQCSCSTTEVKGAFFYEIG